MSDQAGQVPSVETTTAATETPTPTQGSGASPTPAESPSILGDASPEATPPPDPFDPEKITFPEGVSKDDALFGEFSNLAKEEGFSGPQAQKLTDFYSRAIQAASQKQMAQWDKQNADWQAEVKADKEIGGDKLPGTLQTFAKCASDPTLSDPAFREALAATGAGNHPAIVRTLARWAKALSEGGPVQGGPAGSSRTPQTLGEVFYGPNGGRSGRAT